MKYISLFTGIGGLESALSAPILCCELDKQCREVLRRRFGAAVTLHPDVTTLHPPDADVVAGGWPCQDISVAGLQQGLSGKRSGLFFELLRVAIEAGAHTLIAENVPNLLAMEKGQTFRAVLSALGAQKDRCGNVAFPYIAWRTLNARQFGLPHSRERIFIIATRHREIATSLHRPLPSTTTSPASTKAAGFYWTAGLQSLCYSEGFVPTLKVGSSLSIPSPPALHFGNVVRKATADECLSFQGFNVSEFDQVAAKDIYRMTGNAVAAPVGKWVFEGLEASSRYPFDLHYESEQNLLFNGGPVDSRLGISGIKDHGTVRTVIHPATPLASNLGDKIDLTNVSMLSPRAAAGLLYRLNRSRKPCPASLRELLVACAGPLASVTRDLAEDPEFDPRMAETRHDASEVQLF